MKHAFIFPGQGSQFRGMGKEHYDKLFEQANEILGFRISDIMFEGTDEELKQTNVTQPAIFLHSIIAFKSIETIKPDMVAGHSLGEFSALVANGVLSFEDGLHLVAARARAMQHACDREPGTMAAILGLDDEKVETICNAIEEVVVPANYNCPGQLVISGSLKGIEIACEQLKNAGAKRALVLPVGGAFHSPLMMHAEEELIAAIEKANFVKKHLDNYLHTHPDVAKACPVYQNVAAKAVIRPEEIKMNLIHQLTGPVRWTQSVQAMIADGATRFTEAGPGKVLQGLVLKINKEMQVEGVN